MAKSVVITCVRRDTEVIQCSFTCIGRKIPIWKFSVRITVIGTKIQKWKCSSLIAVIGTKIPKCFLLVKKIPKWKKQCPYHCNWYEYQSVQKYKMPKNQKNTMCNIHNVLEEPQGWSPYHCTGKTVPKH